MRGGRGEEGREGEKCKNGGGGGKEGKDHGFGSSSILSSLWLGVLTTPGFLSEQTEDLFPVFHCSANLIAHAQTGLGDLCHQHCKQETTDNDFLSEYSPGGTPLPKPDAPRLTHREIASATEGLCRGSPCLTGVTCLRKADIGTLNWGNVCIAGEIGRCALAPSTDPCCSEHTFTAAQQRPSHLRSPQPHSEMHIHTYSQLCQYIHIASSANTYI